MKEKNKKIKIITAVAALLLAASFFVWWQFNNILFYCFPKVYATKSLTQTVTDARDIIWPLFKDKVNTKVTMKISHLYLNDEEQKKFKKLSVELDVNAFKSSGKYSAVLSAGVSIYRPYKFYGYLDSEKVVFTSPKKRDESILITWDKITELTGKENIYRNVTSNIGEGFDNIKEILKQSEITLVSRSERKFKVVIKYEDNPFPFEECYIYVDKNHRVNRLDTGNFSMKLSGTDNLFDDMELTYENIIFGKINVNMKSALEKSDNKLVFDIDDLNVTYQGREKTVRILLGGKFISRLDELVEPDYDRENVVKY